MITTISLTLIDCALIAIISAIITAFTGFVCFILGVMAGTWLGMQD